MALVEKDAAQKMKFLNPNLSKTEVLTVLLKMTIASVAVTLLAAAIEQIGWGDGMLEEATIFGGGVLGGLWAVKPYLDRRAKPVAASDEADAHREREPGETLSGDS